jgi:excisionase family DNA binding protein
MDRLWTVQETARYMKMSPKYVYRLVEIGVLPHFKLGRRVRIEPKQVRSYLVRNERGLQVEPETNLG